MSINSVDWNKTSIQELAMDLEFDWTRCFYSVDILNSSTGTCLCSLWFSNSNVTLKTAAYTL